MEDFEFEVREAEGDFVEGFDFQCDAEEEAERHAENNDVCCHVSDRQGNVVNVFSS